MAPSTQIKSRTGRKGFRWSAVMAAMAVGVTTALAGSALAADLKADLDTTSESIQQNKDLGSVVGGNTYMFNISLYYKGGPDTLTSVTFDDDGSLPSFVTSATGGTVTRASGNGNSTIAASTITVVAPCTLGLFGGNDGGSSKISGAAVQYAATAVNAGRSLSDVNANTAFVNIKGNVTTLGSNCTVTPPANNAPTANAGGPYLGAEGSSIALSGSGSDTDTGDTIASYKWTYSPVSADAGAACSFSNDTAQSPTISCTDDGSYHVSLKVKDNHGAESAASTVNLTVSNANPTATKSFDTSVNEGSSFSLALTNPSDPGSNDTFTYQFDCGDGNGYSAASPTASRSCPTGDNGTRSVKAKILDDDDGSNEYTGSVTVNNVAPTLSTPAFSFNPYTGVASAGISFSDPGWLDVGSSSFDWAGTTKAGSPASAGPGTGPSALTGTFSSTHTFAPGCISGAIGVTVSDDDGGQASHTFAQANTLGVHTVAFGAPMKDGVRMIVKLGNVIPVKLSIVDCNGNVVTGKNLSIKVQSGIISPEDIEEGTEVIPTSVSSADTTGFMRFADGMYMYNLATKGLSTGLPYTIAIRDGSQLVATAVVEAKK